MEWRAQRLGRFYANLVPGLPNLKSTPPGSELRAGTSCECFNIEVWGEDLDAGRDGSGYREEPEILKVAPRGNSRLSVSRSEV